MSLEGRICVGTILVVFLSWYICWFTGNEQVFMDEVEIMMDSSWEGVKKGARIAGISLDGFHLPSIKDKFKRLASASPNTPALLSEAGKSESQAFKELNEALNKEFAAILDMKAELDGQEDAEEEVSNSSSQVKLGGYLGGVWDYAKIVEGRMITPIFRKALNLQLEDNQIWKNKERQDYRELIMEYFNRQTVAAVDRIGVYFEKGLEAVGKLSAMQGALEALKRRDKKADILLKQLNYQTKELKHSLDGMSKKILAILKEAVEQCPTASLPKPKATVKQTTKPIGDFKHWQDAMEEVSKLEFQ